MRISSPMVLVAVCAFDHFTLVSSFSMVPKIAIPGRMNLHTCARNSNCFSGASHVEIPEIVHTSRFARMTKKRKYSSSLTLAAQRDPIMPSVRAALPKVVIWSAWALYMFHIFLSDAPCGPGATGELCGIGLPASLEAVQLSLNFWFVMPLAFPSGAPVLHPALEGLFNIVVAWGGLFFGFLSDGRQQRVPMLPFLLGTAFLTNVFYLPYLGLRASMGNSSEATTVQTPPTAVLRAAESRWWPALMAGVVVASVVWALYGRGGAEAWGDPAARWAALTQMALHTDRLAHSFLVDCGTFWAFQGVLLPDDLRRRGLDPAHGPGAVAAAFGWALPFVGLAGYLLWRPPLLADSDSGPASKDA